MGHPAACLAGGSVTTVLTASCRRHAHARLSRDSSPSRCFGWGVSDYCPHCVVSSSLREQDEHSSSSVAVVLSSSPLSLCRVFFVYH